MHTLFPDPTGSSALGTLRARTKVARDKRGRPPVPLTGVVGTNANYFANRSQPPLAGQGGAHARRALRAPGSPTARAVLLHCRYDALIAPHGAPPPGRPSSPHATLRGQRGLLWAPRVEAWPLLGNDGRAPPPRRCRDRRTRGEHGASGRPRGVRQQAHRCGRQCPDGKHEGDPQSQSRTSPTPGL